jgi:4-amino-4-deoxy-L-arabinose transferase-like glycosyltransferase
MGERDDRDRVLASRTVGLEWALLSMIVLFSVACYVGWVGYIGADDAVYILNARERVLAPFLIGASHWDVRITLTLPMALSFSIFGESELSAALPTLVYTAATGILVCLFLVPRGGKWAGLMAATMLLSSPLLVVNATSLRIDAVETFCVMASLTTFLVAVERRGSSSFLVFSGVLAGLAFITRPTTIALLAFFGLLFAIGYRIERRRYLLVAAGFLLVWLAESLYYFVGTGDFFYRLSVDIHHDQVTRAGGLLEAVLIAPIKMLLGSHSLGFAFWCLPVAAWTLIRNRNVPVESRSIAAFFTLFSTIWVIVFAGFATKLVLDPRYLTPATAAALVVVALWIDSLMRMRKASWAAAIVLMFLGSHVFAIYLENKDFMYAERWLVSIVKRTREPVYTDPQTSERARFLLELAGLRNQVIPEPPPPGALFLSVPVNAARGRYNKYHWDPSSFVPGTWTEEDRLVPDRKGIGVVLEDLGAQGAFPPEIWRKLNYPCPAITLFRRPE